MFPLFPSPGNYHEDFIPNSRQGLGVEQMFPPTPLPAPYYHDPDEEPAQHIPSYHGEMLFLFYYF